MVHFYKKGTSGDKGTLRHMMIVALRCCIFYPEVFSIHTLSRSNQCLHIFHALLRFSLIVCLCVAFIEPLHSHKRILQITVPASWKVMRWFWRYLCEKSDIGLAHGPPFRADNGTSSMSKCQSYAIARQPTYCLIQQDLNDNLTFSELSESHHIGSE